MPSDLERLVRLYGMTVEEYEPAIEEFERQVSPNINRRDKPVARSWFLAGWKARASATASSTPMESK